MRATDTFYEDVCLSGDRRHDALGFGTCITARCIVFPIQGTISAMETGMSLPPPLFLKVSSHAEKDRTRRFPSSQ